ncbi:hypothetical protein BDN70DRAFT_929196 [Pholiota conissans]|uniref:Protein kinase domain-containing protein n=1 Tax=Pholiota conissans TaxID=109636 RepID=A0A9P6CXZ0_9AGAR|nr:hypothetical protein BDN70DRAFT_929196 [Pholiota conissans]
MSNITPQIPVDHELSVALSKGYELVRNVAHGGTTVVYEVISTRGRLRGRRLALKRVQQITAISSSLSLHRALCHPNIVALHSILDSSTSLQSSCWHILEFCSEGNFSDLLSSRNPSIVSDSRLRQVIKGVANGFIYLKEEGIIHRNIEASNILLDKGCKPKICDFKHATRVGAMRKCSQPLTGTVHPAPELLSSSSQYDFAVDAWSFGCALYVGVGGRIENMSTTPPKISFSLLPEVPVELRSLIHSLLTLDPNMRLEAEQLAKHAYLTIDHSLALLDSSKEPSRSSLTPHVSLHSKRSASVATTLRHIQELRTSRQSYSPRICALSSITRSNRRSALRDVGNIPLPQFLHSKLASEKELIAPSVKIHQPCIPAMNSFPRLTSENSQTTFIDKQTAGPGPCEHASAQFGGTVLPIGTTRPLLIDTSALTPKTHKLANGTVTVLPSRALLVDFRQNQRRHGLKGDQIMLVEGSEILACLIFDAPHLSVPSCLMEPVHRYTLENLPSKYWKQCNDAANFVDLIRRKIPRVSVYGSEAKCTLMSNAPPSDIEILLHGQDFLADKTKARGFKTKPSPILRILYSRQRHSLELAQRFIGEQGTEWKKELKTCIDSSDISKILLLGDTSIQARKGLSILLDFLKTCDQLGLPASANAEQSTSRSLTKALPDSEFLSASLPTTLLPFCEKHSFNDIRYLESIGWCIRRRNDEGVSGGKKYLYQILFLDGSSLVVDLEADALVFSSVSRDICRMPEQPVELTVPQLESTFGVLFIGYIISMVAYGFTFFQTYIYFSRYPMDRRGIKATVASLCLLDTVNSALISHTMYHYLVTYFPLTTGLINATSTYCAEIGFSALAVFIVQLFYSYRVWRVSKRVLLAGAISLVSTVAFAMRLAFTSKIRPSDQGQNAAALLYRSIPITFDQAIITASQALTFFSGTLSTISLFFYLAPSRSLVSKSTENFFEKAVTHLISRGTLATLLQLCFLIAYLTTPGKVVWMPFHLITSKVFINSLFTMLNFRTVHYGRGYTEDEAIVRKTSNATSTFSANGRISSNVRFGAMDSKINIEVTQSIEQDNEEANKVYYDDDNALDSNWHQRRRKEAQARTSDADL